MRRKFLLTPQPPNSIASVPVQTQLKKVGSFGKGAPRVSTGDQVPATGSNVAPSRSKTSAPDVSSSPPQNRTRDPVQRAREEARGDGAPSTGMGAHVFDPGS